MKKSVYSALIALFLMWSPTLLLQAQETDKSPMWESIMLVPDNTKLKVLGENLRKHNMKYHKDGPFNSTVYNIVSGPHIGKIVWMMGPLQYKDLDTRPATGGHDEDWRDNIMPYVKRTEHGEYWREITEWSNTGMLEADAASYPILFNRYWVVKQEHSFGVEAHMKKASKTIKAMPGVHPWGIYDNEFRQGDIGRHMATVAFYKNWADLDTPWPFRATFDEVHGKDAWDTFVKNQNATFSDWWDEIWVYDKTLSGD